MLVQFFEYFKKLLHPEQSNKLSEARFVAQDLIWVLSELCNRQHLSFSAELFAREFPSEHVESNTNQFNSQAENRSVAVFDESTLVKAGKALGLKFERTESRLMSATISYVVLMKDGKTVIASKLDDELIQYSTRLESRTLNSSLAEFSTLSSRFLWSGMKLTESSPDKMDSSHEPTEDRSAQNFGFKWFLPELLKHKRVWRDVLLASLALQILLLTTPLLTQVIIDKVIAHRAESTLISVSIAMGIFVILSGILTWSRQYIVLHTGTRVDAVLGAAVWEHLLKLPLRYFEMRSTGVISARLHAVETIRDFISGAAVSLVLDLPFLLICIALMLYYSVSLTALTLGFLVIIALASIVMAPIFQSQLNEQFMLGARNQAFVTEHIAGFETVKSLQMEPELRKRFGGYLASLLNSTFKTRHVANTYNTFATSMEQAMILATIAWGAYIVMTPELRENPLTIGMLVAYQMLSNRLSQPVLRIVSIWTQFQQASLSVKRLGDVMNVQAEEYSIVPMRTRDKAGRIVISELAFRHSAQHPLLYSNLNLTIEPGKTVAVMGASGSGKSTLIKIMLGFYQPAQGSIQMDGVDIRNFCVNELRAYFGVVPQETILFSGSILANLRSGNPHSSFEQVVSASRLAGIHDVIETLPQGYQTIVGERGVGLSGGQKQRLAIARALIKKPRVLIFDEATSGLDQSTAEAFAKTINQLRGRITMIFVSHALPQSLIVDQYFDVPRQNIAQL